MSGKGSEASKKTVISAKDLPATKVKKEPTVVKRDPSPIDVAKKEAEEK
jgi:hypothetical protein